MMGDQARGCPSVRLDGHVVAQRTLSLTAVGAGDQYWVRVMSSDASGLEAQNPRGTLQVPGTVPTKPPRRVRRQCSLAPQLAAGVAV